MPSSPLLLAVWAFMQTQGNSTAPVPEARPPFGFLRQEEDYSFLSDPKRRTDPFDPIKYIPLGRRGWLTLGVQLREEYEYVGREGFGSTPFARNDSLQQRYMPLADLHLSPQLRLYVELKRGEIDGRKGGPRPQTDRDDLDVEQGFVEFAAPSARGWAAAPFALRAGREELNFGAGREVGVREGPNNRRGFDGAFGIVQTGGWRIDAFASRPVLTNPETFDDHGTPGQALWGVYATRPGLELYYLGGSRHKANFAQGTAGENRHTVGFRASSQGERWDYDVEPAFQFGAFGGGDILAGSVASTLGYTLPSVQRLRFGVSAGLNSGDRDPGGKTLNTFSPPAPTGLYFGRLSAIGPQNVVGFSPEIRLDPFRRATLTLDDFFFWRTSDRDGIYTLADTLQRPGGPSRARFVGNQPEASLNLSLDAHSSVTFDVAYFSTGRYLRESPPGRSIPYFATWYTLTF